MDVRLSLQGDAAAAVITPFVLLLLGWIVAAVARVRVARRQADAWARTIDRLPPDAVGALLRDGGSRLEQLLLGPDRPHMRILVAAQGGVAVVTFGLALLAAAAARAGVPALVGVLVTALGAGLLGAAAVGYWLSARWGLLEGPTRRADPRA